MVLLELGIALPSEEPAARCEVLVGSRGRIVSTLVRSDAAGRARFLIPRHQNEAGNELFACVCEPRGFVCVRIDLDTIGDRTRIAADLTLGPATVVDLELEPGEDQSFPDQISILVSELMSTPDRDGPFPVALRAIGDTESIFTCARRDDALRPWHRMPLSLSVTGGHSSFALPAARADHHVAVCDPGTGANRKFDSIEFGLDGESRASVRSRIQR